jgi:hypothetical protein
MLGDLQKPQGNAFPYGWPYGVALNAVGYELLICDWQSPVVVSTVVRQLDLNPVKDATRGQTEDPVSGGF